MWARLNENAAETTSDATLPTTGIAFNAPVIATTISMMKKRITILPLICSFAEAFNCASQSLKKMIIDAGYYYSNDGYVRD